MKIKIDKDLIESIERLGDLFGQASELANNIRLEIKNKFGYHGDTVDILLMCRSLASAEESYEAFHTYFLEKLMCLIFTKEAQNFPMTG